MNHVGRNAHSSFGWRFMLLLTLIVLLFFKNVRIRREVISVNSSRRQRNPTPSRVAHNASRLSLFTVNRRPSTTALSCTFRGSSACQGRLFLNELNYYWPHDVKQMIHHQTIEQFDFRDIALPSLHGKALNARLLIAQAANMKKLALSTPELGRLSGDDFPAIVNKLSFAAITNIIETQTICNHESLAALLRVGCSQESGLALSLNCSNPTVDGSSLAYALASVCNLTFVGAANRHLEVRWNQSACILQQCSDKTGFRLFGCKFASPVLCSSPPMIDFFRLRTPVLLKKGTKTALYGSLDTHFNQELIMKHFNVLQFAAFQGFHRYVSHRLDDGKSSTWMTYPLIHVPHAACLADDLDASILQLQTVLPGQDMITFLRNPRESSIHDGGKPLGEPVLGWPDTIDVATQILCIFDHLHHHPGGPFSFDDNHPGQYILHRSPEPIYTAASVARRAQEAGRRGSIKVRLIDIDTLQLAHALPKNTPMSEETLYSNVSTKCRCFFCRGRSNCLFLNSPEGYVACGQDSDGDDGNHRSSRNDLERLKCSLRTDAWFLGQLLFVLIDPHSEPPWIRSDHHSVVSRLLRGEVPSVRTEEPLFNDLIVGLFRDRWSPRVALRKLGNLCEKRGCSIPVGQQCPRAQFHPAPVVRGFRL